MHPVGMEEDPVLQAVLSQDGWVALPSTSVPGGSAPPIWKCGFYGIFSSDWVEYEARMYAQSWDNDIRWIEVPDAFAEQHGIR